MKIPKIGITFGDISGIGPEVVMKALRHASLNPHAEFILLGIPSIYEKACRLIPVSEPAPTPLFFHLLYPEMSGKEMIVKSFSPGMLSEESALFAIQWIEQGVQACRKGLLDALVTAPINKEACHRAGFPFKGHTDFIADLCGNPLHRMMFYSQALKVILVTHHQSLLSSIQDLTITNIIDTIRIGHDAMKRFGFADPEIAVCGLNPHAGENGAFGDEELRIIHPAIKKAREEGLPVSGTYPPDTVFHELINKGNTLIVAMNHDQGLIPLKLIAFDSAVNVTAGLPIIRTSPDHGTAFSIAWKGIAKESSMVQSINLAIQMANHT
jgi:4-phospho-D-threonate 3-dehydrogenase / 4-phospho-D-erythronate 3-dehydrogenase